MLATISYLDTDLHQDFDADWVSDELCVQFLCSYGNDTTSEHFDRQRDRWVADTRLLGNGEATARVLGISPTAVSTRLSRALKRLEEKVNEG